MSDILNGLNEKQKEAAQIIDGPVLVLSGPGSGKTRVLTHRVAYLLQNGIKPENILAVTFTNKAAEEMKQRIAKLLGYSNIQLPVIGTFHSICSQILRKEVSKIGYSSNFVIYDESDQLSLIKKTIEELKIDPKQFIPKRMIETISGLKSELVNPEIYSLDANDYFPRILSKIYALYQKKLKENNAFDFDDLIMRVAEIFSKNPDILDKYQEKFRYILVDEYQDTNPAQFHFLKLLAQKYGNIFAIGDEAQSIYEWRHADFRNILNFEKDWPNAKVILLEENYRSYQNILDAAYAIITQSPNFRDKKLWTKNGRGELLIIKETGDEREEANFVVNKIENEKRGPLAKKYSDFVALYRTNAQSRAVEEALINAGIPYKIVGGIKFYERQEIKDILGWLKLIQNNNDSVSLERIFNFTKVSNFQFPIPDSQIIIQITNNKNSKKKKIIQYLLEDFNKKSQSLNLTELIDYILEKIGYENYLRDGSEEGERRWENIEEIFTVASKYDKHGPLFGLQKFLEEVSLLSDQDEIKDEKNAVHLMTFHSAKGLEFPIVFILGCEEGIFPHSKSLNASSSIDEERRLCYVAITRAKEKVYLVFAKTRRLFGKLQANPASRFLQDIPASLTQTEYLENREDGNDDETIWI